MASYIEKSLSNGEEIKAFFKQHWFVWVPIVLWFTVGVLILIGPFVAIYKILQIKTMEFGVTDKRVITKYGIISRSTDEMRIPSVETVEIKQSVFGRIFGYGNIIVTGNGISDVVFPFMSDPIKVKRDIENCLS